MAWKLRPHAASWVRFVWLFALAPLTAPACGGHVHEPRAKSAAAQFTDCKPDEVQLALRSETRAQSRWEVVCGLQFERLGPYRVDCDGERCAVCAHPNPLIAKHGGVRPGASKPGDLCYPQRPMAEYGG